MAFPAARAPARDLVKWAFFGLMGLCTLLVFYVDELFWFNPADKFWLHIASYKGLLIVHALAGLTALLAGPLQFSDTIRRRWPRLHRRTGWTYIVAVAIAAPLAGYIGTTYLPAQFRMEQPVQAGGWFLATAIALICILRRNVPLHRAWMMRSYAFCLIFILSRVPDAFPSLNFWAGGTVTLLWWLIVAALLVPEIILTVRELARTPGRARKV